MASDRVYKKVYVFRQNNIDTIRIRKVKAYQLEEAEKILKGKFPDLNVVNVSVIDNNRYD